MLLWSGLVCYFLQVSSHTVFNANTGNGNGQTMQDWTFLWWESIARKTAQTRYMLSIEWLNIWFGVYHTQQIKRERIYSESRKGEKKRRRSLGNSTITDADADVCPIVPAAGFPLVFGSRSCCAQHIMQLIYNAIQLETSIDVCRIHTVLLPFVARTYQKAPSRLALPWQRWWSSTRSSVLRH
jgi:hypothetical protein